MKTYSFFRGNLCEGILLQHTRRGLGLVLGQEIAGGKQKTIVLDPENPPEIVNGYVARAVINEVVVQESNRLLRHKKKVKRFLAKPLDKGDNRCLLHINTDLAREGKGRGFWKKIRGNPRDVTVAIRLNEKDHTCFDGLVIMSCGDMIEIDSEGSQGYLFCENGIVKYMASTEWVPLFPRR